MEIPPGFLMWRHAGMKSWFFQHMRSVRTMLLLDELEHSNETLESLRPIALAKLEESIGRCSDPEQKRLLVQLRRDIYNRRQHEIAGSKYGAGASLGKDGLLAPALEWVSGAYATQLLVREGEALLDEELKACLKAMLSASRHLPFRRALAIASPAFSRELEKILRTGQAPTGAKLTRIRRTLTHYICRASTKTSPFSSFMYSTLMMATGHAPLQDGASNPRVSTTVHLNRALLTHIAVHYATALRESRKRNPHLNSSITFASGKIFLLKSEHAAQIPDRMRIPKQQLIVFTPTQALAELITRWDRGAMSTWEEFREEFLPSISNDEAMTLRCQWTRLGLMTEANAADAGDTALAPMQSVRDPYLAISVEERIREVAIIEGQLGKASPCSRSEMFESCRGIFRSLFESDTPVPPDWAPPPLFEDVVQEPSSRVIPCDVWRPLYRDLNEFCINVVTLLDGNSSLRETLKALLRTHYADRESVPVLEFLHGLRSLPKLSREEAGFSTPNPHRVKNLEQLAQIRGELASAICLRDSDELDLRRHCLDAEWRSRAGASGVILDPRLSHYVTIHLQHIGQWSGRDHLVLNTLEAGPFRILMRYCAGLPEGDAKAALISRISAVVVRTWPQATVCDIGSEYDFNPNRHPKVVDWRILCSGEAISSKCDLSLDRLHIHLDRGEHLSITDAASGRRLIPISFGMLGGIFRPLVQQMLLAVNTIDPLLHSRPFHPYRFRSPDSNPEYSESYGRLVFGSIVVRRRGWSISTSRFPTRDPKESSFGLYRRVHRWRLDHLLPDQVFVTVEATAGAPAPGRSTRAWSHSKPQLIDFGSFQSVDLLAQTIATGASRLYFEEVLPRLPGIDDRARSRVREYACDIRCDHLGHNRIVE